MLLKKTIGIIIILLNIGGIGFLLYRAGLMVKEKYFKKEPPSPVVEEIPPAKEKGPTIPTDNIIEDEDDLLKDMDLSDLDNLDLDDFK
ncbi:MAG: hypothetical protein M0T82_09500 [Desulfobacteraceae bacterium]|nr:hypothetical protein [Desulfobacteraceae bacterium]